MHSDFLSSVIRVVLGLALLSVAFALIEWLAPARPQQRRWRTGVATDLGWWFFTPLATKAITRVSVGLALIPVLIVIGRPLSREALLAGFGPVVHWPTALQVIAALVLGDFIGYWTHRAFHARGLWRFHAIHHSSTELDWLSSVRVHPVNDVLGRIAQALPLVVLGFPPLVVAAYLPFLTLYAIVLHANVSWDFGPLRYVFASPRFHRWHHTSAEEGLDKNFAGLLPIWDLVFGTLYLPDRQPTMFGVPDAVPTSLVGQLAWPFKSARKSVT